MCTAVSYKTKDHDFGRNLDLEYSYNEQVVITPKNYRFNFTDNRILDKGYAIIGIATVCENYPLYYDACNEYGLAGAGLNFPYNDLYSNDENSVMLKIAPYEILPAVLRTCKSIAEVKELLTNTIFINKSFNDNFKATNMHYMFADSCSSITVESKNGVVNVYDNTVNVLTNTPTFIEQIENLKQYQNITNEETNKTLNSKGTGALGLPGDFTSKSRFVRAEFLLRTTVSLGNDLTEFYNVLSSVAEPKGSVKVNDNKYFYTQYSSCMDLKEKIYYYKTYENSRIYAVRLSNIDGKDLAAYDLIKTQDIRFQN